MLTLIFFAAAFVTAVVGVYQSGPAKVDRRYSNGYKYNRAPKPEEIHRSESMFAITGGLAGAGLVTAGFMLREENGAGLMILFGLLLIAGAAAMWVQVQRREDERVREEQRRTDEYRKQTRMMSLLKHLEIRHSGPGTLTEDERREARDLLAMLGSQELEPFPYDDATFQDHFAISTWAKALHKKLRSFGVRHKPTDWSGTFADLDPSERGVLDFLVRLLLKEPIDGYQPIVIPDNEISRTGMRTGSAC